MPRRRLEINLTMRCNIACPHCNRLIADLPLRHSDITIPQLHLMADSLKEHNITMRYLKVLGGEPLVHHDFLGAMNVLKERIVDEGITKSVAVVTNAILDRPELPQGFEYWLSPVKDKNHIPVLASPTDLGVEHKMREECITKKRCGFSFDAWGFTFCPISGILGRVLGVDTYRNSIPESKLDYDNICRHCPFGLHHRTKMKVKRKVRNKEIEYPSKTYKEGLEREKIDPMVFEKFGGDYSYTDDYQGPNAHKELVQLEV